MCLLWRVIALNMSYLALYGCTTTALPAPDAPTLDTVKQTFCRLSAVGDAPDGNMLYAYDPDHADMSEVDTLQSVEQMIRLNETRNLLCKETT